MSKSEESALVTLLRYSEIGFIIPAGIILGYLVGKGLEHWLHRSWLPVAGVIFGVIVGFISMIRFALKSENEP
jgi:Putative F0F1-ATPase subunit Ca2+/Mg2+ transporter